MPLYRLGKLAEDRVPKNVVVEVVDAGEVVQPQQQKPAWSTAAVLLRQPRDPLFTLPLGKEAGGVIHLALIAQTGHHPRKHDGLAHAVPLEAAPADHPYILALPVADLVFHVVLVGLAVHHLLNRLEIAAPVPLVHRRPQRGTRPGTSRPGSSKSQAMFSETSARSFFMSTI